MKNYKFIKYKVERLKIKGLGVEKFRSLGVEDDYKVFYD
jgi:hypothetical protein